MWTKSYCGRFIARFFTLLELLLVVTIIAVLTSILLPSLNKSREMSKRSLCANNMKNIGLATIMYVNDYDYYLPYYNWTGDFNMLLMPYLGNGPFYWGVKHFVCPSETRSRIIPGNGFFTDPGDYSTATLGYSYMGTVSAYGEASNSMKLPKYGGAQLYNLCGTKHKRFTRVIDHSVLMIEEAMTGYIGYSQPVLIALGFNSRSYYSLPEYFPNAGGASFYHNLSSNFLYQDGSVKTHRSGTRWNNEWQLEK